MEKQSKAPLIYGYAVCLVTVITFIICIAGLIDALIDSGDPLHAERDFQKTPSLASFENYKMDILTASDKAQNITFDDETLKVMYESAKNDKIQAVKHRTSRDMMVNGFLIVVCILLFIFHWRWMRKFTRSAK